MKIHNVRVGTANNSSSSHSIVFFKKTDLSKSFGDSGLDYEYEFSWDPFVCSFPESKMRYLVATLYDNLKVMMGGWAAYHVVNSLFGIKDEVAYDSEYDSANIGIDHQSRIQLPRTPKPYHKLDECPINMEFFDDLTKYMMQKNVVIFGGNDNDEKESPPEFDKDYAKVFDLKSINAYSSSLIARKDPLGFWTLFNTETGTKVRLSFDHVDFQYDGKTTYPELVDIKITNKCNSNCAFCYQDSNSKGEHAKFDDIESIMFNLRKIGVFEVALGGGEPTLHPSFIKILDMFNQNHINANFSTKQLAWMDDSKLVEKINNNNTTFAYSACNQYDIRKAYEKCLQTGIDPHEKMSIQIVEGICDGYYMEEIIKYCSTNCLRLTLLGFKECGRGIMYKNKHDCDLRELVKKYDGKLNVAIDTCLADKWTKTGSIDDIPRVLYDVKDGKSSLYVDLIQGYIAPSSWNKNEDSYRKFKMTTYSNLEDSLFKTF